MMTPLLELKPSRFEYFRPIPYTAALTYAFYWMHTELGQFPSPILWFFVMGGVCSMLFLSFYIYLFITAQPLLAIYDNGIVVNSTGIDTDLIQWNEIKRIEYPEGGTTNLNVYLNDSQSYFKRQPMWVSMLSTLLKPKFRGAGESPTVQLSLVGYMNRVEEVKNSINKRYKQ
jgi:hypothetical protein